MNTPPQPIKAAGASAPPEPWRGRALSPSQLDFYVPIELVEAHEATCDPDREAASVNPEVEGLIAANDPGPRPIPAPSRPQDPSCVQEVHQLRPASPASPNDGKMSVILCTGGSILLKLGAIDAGGLTLSSWL